MDEIDLIVLSRGEAERYVPAYPTAYVSIYTPGDEPAEIPPHPLLSGVLRIAFHDLDNANFKNVALPELITKDQASVIRSFVQAAYDAGVRHFLIHCDAGISRSCGVASALDAVFNNADKPRPRYMLRNRLVERLVLEAFKGPVVPYV